MRCILTAHEYLVKFSFDYLTQEESKNIFPVSQKHVPTSSYVMELGHLLTCSGLMCPEISSKVCHDSFCQSGSCFITLGNQLQGILFTGAYNSMQSYGKTIQKIQPPV
jgi:hypothetical protein